MPEILRLHGHRVRLAEDTPEHIIMPHALNALYDMVDGETHAAIVLGDDAEAVNRRITGTHHPLTVIGTFFVHTTHSIGTTSRRRQQTVNGSLLAPDGSDAVVVANRYRRGIAPYAVRGLDNADPYFDQLDAEGTRLVAAVTTLGLSEEPGSEFDVLYVPYLSPEITDVAALTGREYPIRAAALLADQALAALIERS